MRPRRCHPAIALAALASMAGCVTERVGPSRPGPSRQEPPTVPALPSGPVAAPAAGAITNTRVRIAIAPLGSVPYDGQVLPLVSPDGVFLAVEEGTAPTWPTLVAGPEAATPIGTGLAIYTIRQDERDDKPADGRPGMLVSVQKVELAEPLPPGLMLGRAADSEGFLVESPRPDGSRWIGKVAWASGRLNWLVQDGRVNAHGVLTTGGELVYTRREISGTSTELVIRAESGAEEARQNPAGAYLFPMTTTDPAALYVLGASEAGLELVCFSLQRDPPRSGTARLGAVIARSHLNPQPDLLLAYQIAAPTQSTGTLAEPGNVQQGIPEPLVIYHPRLGRMASFDKATGHFNGLAAKSIAATWWSSESERGYFCTAPEGVVFTPYVDPSEALRPGGSRPPDARVLGTPYVMRRTKNEAWPLITLGPSRLDPGRIQVAAVAIVRDPM